MPSVPVTLPKTNADWIQAALSLLAIAFGSAIQGIWETDPQTLAMTLGVTVGGLVLFWQATRKRSRLLKPEALRLDFDKAEHLYGREDEVKAILGLIRNHKLIHLDGEPGAGKSALMRGGVYPALQNDAQYFPLYVRDWGEDWEKDPTEHLAQEIWHALIDTQQRSLFAPDTKAEIELLQPKAEIVLDAMSSTDATKGLPSLFKKVLGRTPVIIFDQFDDYQVQHQQRFKAEDGSWLAPEELCQNNLFWARIRTLLQDRLIGVVFVTRADNASALSTVQFTQHKSFTLFRLPPHTVSTILTDRLSDSDETVVEYPENGWISLQQRVQRDLERAGGGMVLPVQMKQCLLGLQWLKGKTLTVRAYENAGKLDGLEVLLLDRHLRQGEQKSGLRSQQLLRLLLCMVDDQPELPKTVAQTLDDFHHALWPAPKDAERDEDQQEASPGTSTQRKQLEQALDYFSGRGVQLIRPVLGGGAGVTKQKWKLDHDYLCRAVLQKQRQSNRWRFRLVDGQQALEDADTLQRKVAALLSPWEQVSLWLARLAGKFQFDKYRRYALWSLLTWLPFVIILLMGGWGYRAWNNTEQANSILFRFDQIEGLNPADKQALGDLAHASWGVRRRVLDVYRWHTPNPDQLTKLKNFETHRAFIVHVALGWRQEDHDRFVRDILIPALKMIEKADTSTQELCTLYARTVPQAVVRVDTSDVRKVTEQYLRSWGSVSCMETYVAITSLLDGRKISTSHADKALKKLAQKLPDSPRYYASWARAIARLAPMASDSTSHADEALKKLAQKLPDDPSYYAYWAGAIARLVRQASPEIILALCIEPGFQVLSPAQQREMIDILGEKVGENFEGSPYHVQQWIRKRDTPSTYRSILLASPQIVP